MELGNLAKSHENNSKTNNLNKIMLDFSKIVIFVDSKLS